MTDLSKHPVLKEAYDLIQAIEELGTGEKFTAAVIKASALMHSIDEVVKVNLDNKDRWRPEVKAFADAMEAKLKANDHKGGWNNCGTSMQYLFDRLLEETEELEVAVHDKNSVLEEAADVANFAMMIADVAGELLPPPPTEEV